jgi:ABC-2 type transport system permease protein
VLLIGRFFFGVPIEGSLLLLELMILLFIISALSLGILISTAVETQQTAMMISMVGLMMPTILLSGFIFPIRNMPMFLQVISNVIPARWFVDIVRGVMLKGNNFSIIWMNALIMFGMTVFFIAMSVRRYKTRLE